MFVVTKLVVLMTTLRPNSTSGGYLLSSRSMSGFSLNKRRRISKLQTNELDIFTGIVISRSTSSMCRLVGLLMTTLIWSPPILFMVLPRASTCWYFFAVTKIREKYLGVHSKA
jgi:hypothetical protein